MGFNAHFNWDLTLMRGALALRRWMARVEGRNRIFLDRTLPNNGVGVLSTESRMLPWSGNNWLTKSVTVALQQAGYGYCDITDDDLAKYSIIFATRAFVASTQQGPNLKTYVQNGGILVLSPGFFSETNKAVRSATIPGARLSEAWGLNVTPGNYLADGSRTDALLDGISPTLKGRPLDVISGLSGPHSGT